MSRFVSSSLGLIFLLSLTGCRFTLDRELDPGDLRGTLVVVDADGVRHPAAGAHVSLENAPVVVKADANGRFVLRALPFGRYDLKITWKPSPDAPGEPAGVRMRDIDLSANVGAVDLGTVEIAGLGAVRGVVVGAEADGVDAILAGVGKVRVSGGAFSFEGLPSGDYEVALVGERGVWSGGSVKVKPRAATDVEIDTGNAPQASGSISGRVMRVDGGPLTGVSVFLAGVAHPPDEIRESGAWSQASIPAGAYTLVATAPGMYTTQIPYVVVAGASVAPDLVLVPTMMGCALGGDGIGDATDADGDGVPDADEPDVCLCHPGFVDANADGVCDDPDEETPRGQCATNDDCRTPGEVCNPTTRVCEPEPVPSCGGNDCADGGFCLDDVCVECRDSGDCGRGQVCNDVTNVCEPDPVLSCGGNDCADGGFCLDDVCVECRPGSDDCGPGQTCNEIRFVCESLDWSIELGAGIEWMGDRPLGSLGNPFELSVDNLPANATYEVGSTTRPRAEFFPMRAGGYNVEPNGIGALSIDVSVTRDGEPLPETKTVVVQVVHDPHRAIFFDPVNGNNSNTGTLDEPKKDVGAYLSTLGGSTEKRHLYIASGNVTFTGVAESDLLFGTNRGSDPIIVTGGFRRENEGWHRDLENARTRFIQDVYPSESRITISGESTDVVLDGLVVENENGVICQSKATLRLLNSQVNARNMRALETNDCRGLAAGNILLPGSYTYLNATVTMNAPSGAPSPFRLIHNLVVNRTGQPYSRFGRLGGEIRYNTFLSVNGNFTIDSARELDGNSFSTLDRTPLAGTAGLARLNLSLLSRDPNNGMQCAKIQDHVALAELQTTGRFELDADQPDCDVHTPLPLEHDVIDHYALRYDRNGETRHDTRRSRGPTERPYTPPAPQVVAETSSSEMVVTVGTPFVVQGTTNASSFSWDAEATGMDFVIDKSQRAQGLFTVTANAVGSAGVRLSVFDLDTQETAHALVRLDVRPNRDLVFVDFNATEDGNGSELSPRNVWPSTLTAGADVLVAEAFAFVGQQLPGATEWLPEGVRVFGGYARAADGRFIRRLGAVETHLGNKNGNTAVLITAGNPSAPPTSRVVDGITFAAPTSMPAIPALIAQGPLLLVRSRVISEYYNSPSVLEVGAQSSNLAVVGSTIAYRPSNQMGTLDLVRLAAGAAPTFLLNDLQRGYGMSGSRLGSAFRVMGDSVKGVYGGNRYWVDSQGTSSYVFFDLAAASDFTPSVLNGNGYAPQGSATFQATNQASGDWNSIVTDPVDDYADNRVSDSCAGAWPLANRWAEASTGECANGAEDAGLQAFELETDLTPADRVGASFDIYGQERSHFGASIGAVEDRDLSPALSN